VKKEMAGNTEDTSDPIMASIKRGTHKSSEPRARTASILGDVANDVGHHHFSISSTRVTISAGGAGF